MAESISGAGPPDAGTVFAPLRVLKTLRLRRGKAMSAETSSNIRTGVARTGVSGLDNVLEGGFPRGYLYLVEGQPGSGKTTMALQS